MFTEEEIKSHLANILNTPQLDGMMVETRNQFDFKTPASEQHIDIVRVGVSEGVNLLIFWIKAIQLISKGSEGEADYAEYFTGDCEEIERNEFYHQIRQTMVNLHKPLKIYQDHQKFFRMRNEWNDLMLIGKSASEYFYYNWYTTA